MPKPPLEPGCDNCTFKKHTRLLPIITKEVAGVPRTLFVGEAPVETEVRAGQLSEGKDSALFHQMVDRFKITNYAITNACLCYPGKGEKPKVTHMASCSIWLETFIKEFQPDRIICLGKFAARAVLGKEVAKQKMYKLREQSPLVLYPDELKAPSPYEGKQIFVTYSPKAIFKRPKLIDDFVADLDFVFNPPEPTFIDPKIVYLKTIEEWRAWYALSDNLIRELTWSNPVALDFETTGLHPIADRPVTIALAWVPEWALAINLHDMTDEEMATTLSEIAQLLEQSQAVIYHESKFDMKFFKQWSGIKPPLGWDTKLVDYVLTGNPEASRGLKYLARRKMYAPAYNEDIEFDGTTPIKDMAVYNGRDSSATLQLYNLQVVGEKIWQSADLIEHLYTVTDMLVEVELKGAPVREAWLQTKREELTTKAEAYQQVFEELELNPNSPKQVREFFDIDSSDKEALKVVDNSVAKNILEYRAIAKELSTYVEGFSKSIVNGRVHTTYVVPGTLTGRLASRNPNMMNLKSDDDDANNYQLVVDTNEPGKVITRFDYSQIEMRKLAVECLDEHLLDVFRTGRDIHGELQKEIFGVEYDEESQTQRVHAKSTNFGTIYGISPYGLSKMLKTDERAAERYLSTWYEMYPGVGIWQNEIKEQVRNHKYVRTQFGRQRRVDLEYLVVYEDTIFRECINFPIQSECCDIYLKAALDIWNITGLYPIQFVHDELVYELATEDLDDTIDYICWKMKKVAEDITNHIVPFPVEVK